MDTTNSLSNYSDTYELRIVDVESPDDSFILPLREVTNEPVSVSDASAFFCDDYVKENTDYEIKLICNQGKRPRCGKYVIRSGGKDELVDSCLSDEDSGSDKECVLQFREENGKRKRFGKFFQHAFGFVSIELELVQDPTRQNSKSLFLTTDKFAVACDRKEKAYPLRKMFQELTSIRSVSIRKWMIPSEQPTDENIGFLNTYGIKSPSSYEEGEDTFIIEAYLEQWNEILGLYERYLNFFRCRPYKKISSYQQKVDALLARSVGRSELEWLSKNPEVFCEIGEGFGCKLGGTNYTPVEVMTQKFYRSYDVDENRAVVAFLEHICKFISETKNDVKIAKDKLTDDRDKFQDLMINNKKNCFFPNLELLNFELDQISKPLLDRIEKIRVRAKCLLEAYYSAMPKITKIDYSLPHRSKVFQEIKPYFYFHEEMRRWQRFDGCEAELQRFVVQAWEIPKLYEYYCLYRLLDELRGQYDPDLSFGLKRFERFEYPDDPPIKRYANELYINNIYHFISKSLKNKKRDVVEITLYYQPVIPNDDLLGRGFDSKRIDLKRTKRTSEEGYNFFTPDYYLRICHKNADSENKENIERIVLDAKFSKLDPLRKYGTLVGCRNKYRNQTEVADGREGGRTIDHMYLLSGQLDEEKEIYEEADDGIAPVYPGADRLHELLVVLGVLEEEEE